MSTTTAPLTQEEKRIKIAEACGWSQIENRNTIDAGGGSIYGYPPKNAVIGKKEHLPRFFNDLNAMAEAEKTMSNEDFTEYHRQLYLATKCDDMWAHNRAFISMSAETRAECFGKTLNLW